MVLILGAEVNTLPKERQGHESDATRFGPENCAVQLPAGCLCPRRHDDGKRARVIHVAGIPIGIPAAKRSIGDLDQAMQRHWVLTE